MKCRDLPSTLDAFVESKRHEPFAWGKNDCCLFACDWLRVLHGVDPAARLGLRDTYSTALGAWRIIKEAGGIREIASTACALHGWPEVPVRQVHRGDIVAIDSGDGLALGVCLGDKGAFPGKSQMAFRPSCEFVVAWRTT